MFTRMIPTICDKHIEQAQQKTSHINKSKQKNRNNMNNNIDLNTLTGIRVFVFLTGQPKRTQPICAKERKKGRKEGPIECVHASMLKLAYWNECQCKYRW